jgi:hypothetical protein
MITPITQITRKMFYYKGGFANPKLFKMSNGRQWCYYQIEG